MLVPLVPLLSIEWGAPISLVGLLVGLAYALPLLFALPAGSFVDTLGPARMLAFGSLLFAAAPVYVLLMPSLASLAFMQAFAGLAFLLIGLSSQSLVALVSTERNRERGFGLYTTAASIGQLVGPLLSGLLLDASGYRLPLVVAGAVSGVAALLVLIQPSKTALRRTAVPQSGSIRAIREVHHLPGLKVGTISSAYGVFALAAYQAFLPAHLEGLTFSATQIGVALSLRSLGSLAIRPALSWVTRLAGARGRALALGLLLIGLAIAPTGQLSTPVSIGIAALAVGIGFGLSQPLSMIAALEGVNRSTTGLALGYRMFGNQIGQLAGPVLMGMIAARAGIGIALLFCGLLVGPAIYLVARLGRPV